MDLKDEIQKYFPQMESYFNENTLKEFINCNFDDLCLYHFGFGTWIRNNILQPDSIIYQMFINSGIYFKDDMSSLMIKLFYINIKINLL